MYEEAIKRENEDQNECCRASLHLSPGAKLAHRASVMRAKTPNLTRQIEVILLTEPVITQCKNMQPSVKRGKSEWMQVMSGAIFALDWLKRQRVCSDWLKQVARKLKPIRKASKLPNKTHDDCWRSNETELPWINVYKYFVDTISNTKDCVWSRQVVVHFLRHSTCLKVSSIGLLNRNLN